MNAVGIDVSKGKSMVSVLHPFGEVVAQPFKIRHTISELDSLASYLQSLDGETRVILEHTGRYYEPVARKLHEAGIFVSAVNPRLIKDYGNNSLRKVKTDKADPRDAVKYYMAQCYVYFLQFSGEDSEYCAYVRAWLSDSIGEMTV